MPGCNGDFNGVERRHVFSQFLDNRRRQRRERTRSRVRRSADLQRLLIHSRGKVVVEPAPVGKIQVVRPGGKRCVRNTMILPLKLPHTMNDEFGR